MSSRFTDDGTTQKHRVYLGHHGIPNITNSISANGLRLSTALDNPNPFILLSEVAQTREVCQKQIGATVDDSSSHIQIRQKNIKKSLIIMVSICFLRHVTRVWCNDVV